MLREQGKDTDKLWEQMADAIVKTFCAVEHRVTPVIQSDVPYRWVIPIRNFSNGKLNHLWFTRSNAFELLGYDFLIDENLHPWILEVNHAPNLEPHTKLETEIKESKSSLLLQFLNIASSTTFVR